MRRGPKPNPQVQLREQQVYAALDHPSTSRDVSQALGISIPAVRLSLKRLREKGTVTLNKIDGVFLWSKKIIE